jgi:hypothetical protein
LLTSDRRDPPPPPPNFYLPATWRYVGI